MSDPLRASCVLVQFRFPSLAALPKGVRIQPLSDQAPRGPHPFEKLLERFGASLEDTPGVLRLRGFSITKVYAQQRFTAATEFKQSKPYWLLTYTFRTGKEARAVPHAEEHFVANARQRYEAVEISRGGQSCNPLLSIMAKTVAQTPKQSELLSDAEAEAFGLRLTKALPKQKRAVESAVA